MSNLQKVRRAWHRAKLLLAIVGLLAIPAAARAAESPRSGGELVFAVGEIPPSFDGHRETTFGMLHPVAPHYSTLLRFDPQNYPKIVGDVAESWSFSRDGLTLTVKIRRISEDRWRTLSKKLARAPASRTAAEPVVAPNPSAPAPR